jgi:hypothetical protein
LRLPKPVFRQEEKKIAEQGLAEARRWTTQNARQSGSSTSWKPMVVRNMSTNVIRRGTGRTADIARKFEILEQRLMLD